MRLDPTRRSSIACALVAALALAGCSKDKGVRCEDSSLYGSSTSIPPVRVPDDLSVPDESQSLLIPGASPPVATDAAPPTDCLESPPDYFGADPE